MSNSKYHSYPEEHAPFVRHDRYGVMGLEKQGILERVRLSVAYCTVLPLRLFTSIALVALFYLVCLAFPKNEQVNRTALRITARTILLIIGFGSIEVDRGGEGVPSAGVVCNHVGWTDILILSSIFGPSFVARSATKDTPLIGRVSMAMNCLFVEREKQTDGSREGIATQLKERMKSTYDQKSRPVVIFAEGTTTNGNYLLPFKSGAFLACLPLTLVIVKYTTSTGGVSPAWESISGLRHLCLMLCERRHKASVKVLSISPKPGESPKEYCQRARQTMLETANLSSSKSTFSDKQQYHKRLRQEHDKFE
ncbi:glycerol-3-phosphate 1-acyltransferase [Chloropicon primus]|uniref:Glycerol-3-phosphate 1-acyltransferase n=1 Tax=Chloropicon primus TaxID=1764295 RepID=A0A5B8MN23_9CHLO|nr:glycerol-3-phosphate 1-acyltransferase [Chloropicon primus]UPR01017.1 glycerol-3-phosphate 1-acyltransferase [Chloropicon primus]|mmetsp:Transcript_12406/g.34510  ORF Transcript_12406/g.34510 Transcript_12406/m.34510 type:complete len:309 (+) Transcript_12406:447-1373(+)|eukprot:QDZ21797.1 glycerol-3-phosphate 1-acyltransferase [Chloropicon primus]